jgi:hypothetical protein
MATSFLLVVADSARAPLSLFDSPIDPFLLQCTHQIAAMQTSRLSLASGIPRLSPARSAARRRAFERGPKCPKPPPLPSPRPATCSPV